MALRIRKATAADYHALCELSDELDALHRENLPHMFRRPDGPVREPDYYAGLMVDENVAFFVAERDETLVGFVLALIRDAPAWPVFVPRRYAVVDSIAVKSEFRHQGIGRRLMATVQRWASARGVSSVDLNVYAFNTSAIAFYERLGYQIYTVRMSRDLPADGTGRS